MPRRPTVCRLCDERAIMRIVSEGECREWLETNLAIGFTRKDLDAEYASCATYQLPTDTGAKTILARLVSHSIDAKQSGLFWITAWGIFLNFRRFQAGQAARFR